MKVQELTKAEFLKKVANYEASPNKWVYEGDKPCIVDFYATWCGPCKMMAPVVAQLAEEYEGTVKVGKLDIDQNVDIVAQYKIMSVPTFLVIKDGEIKAKLIGAVSKEELVDAIDQAK
mgnify:FL=1